MTKYREMSRRQDILDIQRVYTEAMNLSMARQHKMSSKHSGAYKIPQINEVFGDKHRLIYNLDVDYNKSFNTSSESADSPYSKVSAFLSELGYTRPSIKSYIDGFVQKPGDKNVYKIGRILAQNEAIQPKIANSKGNSEPEYSSEFKNDPIRHIKEQDLVIVISRHPYDIYGMSTERMWTSCMDMIKKKEGNKSDMIKAEVEKGTLIAYLTPRSEVYESGKVALRKPVARVLLKPMYNEDNELAYALSTTYGGMVDDFNDFLRNWIDEKFNSKVKNTDGFTMADGVYEDPYETVGKIGEISYQERNRRKTTKALQAARNKILPPTIKLPVKVTYQFGEDGDIHCNINIVIAGSATDRPIVLKREQLKAKPKIIEQYNLSQVIDSDYFDSIFFNPTMNTITLRFYASSDALDDVRKITDIISFMEWVATVPVKSIRA
jgi:hypothetical protein